MIKAVIFDKDGVLIDTEHVYVHSYNQVLKHHGLPQAYTMEDRKNDAGMRSDVIFKRIKEQHHLPSSVDELKKLNFEAYMKFFHENGVKLFDGVLEFIERLKQKKILLAVATGASKE